MEPVRRAAEDAVKSLGGILSVTAVMTAHREVQPEPQQQPQKSQQPQQQQKELLPQIGAIVAVASGKGGVGKSNHRR